MRLLGGDTIEVWFGLGVVLEVMEYVPTIHLSFSLCVQMHMKYTEKSGGTSRFTWCEGCLVPKLYPISYLQMIALFSLEF